LDETTYSTLSIFFSEYEQWFAAFKPLLRRARSAQGEAIFKGATLAKIYALTGYLWPATATPNSQVTRRFTRELEEIVYLSKVLMELPGESIVDDSFSLDTRIVLPLTVVGWAYRHRALRRTVIDIFSKLTRREGLWDTIFTGKAMQWVLELEEVGLTDQVYVPEDAVLKITNMDTNTAARTTLVRGVQNVRGCKGKTVLRDTVIQW